MRGIELSEAYYKTCGEPMLKAEFPELFPRLAAGVCGPGSENFGFDDEISRDHDFDPGFFLWLTPEDYKTYEFRLSRAYDRLPDTFEGVPVLGKSVYETARHGVRETGAFFAGITGFASAPETNLQWLSVPDHRLAAAVNGKIFYDGQGDVTAVRGALSAMPEDVRRKKLAKYVIFAAQAGQYNYARALKHGEPGAAVLALSRFAENYAGAAFLLNRQYAPFYKWVLKAGRALPKLGDEIKKIERALTDPPGKETAEIIESAAAQMIKELTAQGLSDYPSEFLEPHAYEIMKRIEDPALRHMHVME
jgi:hypothetical protein